MDISTTRKTFPYYGIGHKYGNWIFQIYPKIFPNYGRGQVFPLIDCVAFGRPSPSTVESLPTLAGLLRTAPYCATIIKRDTYLSFIFHFFILFSPISSPVDGGYSDWSDWTSCSRSCGPGVTSRHRTCNKPAPTEGGADCSNLGPAFEQRPCALRICPGKFSATRQI